MNRVNHICGLKTRFLQSFSEVSPETWNDLWATDYPFIQHAFLWHLENSGATLADSGWQAHHLTLWQDSTLIAAMPLYIKAHSYGEYVFDWSWANAYAEHGYNYYPKLLSAVPFTPSTGPRIALSTELAPAAKEEVLHQLFVALEQEQTRLKASSCHILFPDKDSQNAIEDVATNTFCTDKRLGCQFHWFNNHYKSFSHFLETFNSRKRKSLKRERKKVTEQEINVRMVDATEISESEWRLFYQLYHQTYLKRSGRAGYLPLSFFIDLAKAMPKQILMAQAKKHDELIAAALYFRDSTTLYGRYWGAIEEYDGLHFECCYYQGIEYCIHHQLERFDPGAQGEHKIQRGFSPVLTCSYHSLEDPQFRNAVAGFLRQEAPEVIAYAADAQTYLPFKENIPTQAMKTLLNTQEA